MRALAFGLVLLASAAPVLGDAADDYDTAVRRLRACITSGAGGAPRDSLASSVTALRALCGHQIRAVQTIQAGKIEQENPTPRTPADKDRLAKLKADAVVRLNNEIAVLVARLTGYVG